MQKFNLFREFYNQLSVLASNFSVAMLLSVIVFIGPAHCTSVTLVTEEYTPLSFMEDGNIRGYSVEVVEEMLLRSKIDYSLGIYPWARAYQMARSLPNTIIFSLARTTQREHLFKWIGGIGRRKIFIYKLASRKDIFLKTASDISKYKVGINRGDILQAEFEELGLVSGKGLDLSNKSILNFNKLLAGRVDLIAGTEFSIRALCEQTGEDTKKIERLLLVSDRKEYYIAASLGTSQNIVDNLQKQLKSMKADGFITETAIRYKIFSEIK